MPTLEDVSDEAVALLAGAWREEGGRVPKGCQN